MNTLYVFDVNSQAVIGRLKVTEDQAYEFRYANSYLDSDEALALNPVHLPLDNKLFYSKQDFAPNLLAIADALPGAWGRHVLNTFAGSKLSDMALLLENQKDRIGNLIFSESMTFPDVVHDFIKPPFEWERILAAKARFEENGTFDKADIELFKQGASQGGARPKLTVHRDGNIYIAKLPSVRDLDNKAQIEHGTMRLAHSLGLNVAESEFIKLGKGQDIFLTKRFDYTDQGDKTAYISMQSILGAEHNLDASYGNFALHLRKLNGTQDNLELFKRMVFNSLVSNHDDHYQNHAIYFKDGLWRLTPTFDVVAGESNNQYHAINIGVQGNRPNEKNLLSECDKFGLTQEEANDIFYEMKNKLLATWKTVFEEEGIDASVINSISWAFGCDYK